MSRAGVAAGLLVWLGATLLLGEWRRFARPRLADRLAPFSPGARPAVRTGLLSVESLTELVGPAATGLGNRMAALLGVPEDLDIRLRRVHSPLAPVVFRTRQLGWSLAAATPGLLLAAAGVALPLVALAVLGAPVLAFLLVEQHLATRSARWQADLTRELPVVSEQLAMLLNAGFSLGAALNRLATRGLGAAAADLGVVVARIRQGVAETDALREWAEVARVEAVTRLVGVLALNSESGDLGRLVVAEARTGRRDLQRRTTETIERRAQQVWVPVTVATLVPGVILLAVPFLAALRLFSSP